MVLAASFFSHLPAATFGGWLTRLVSFLAPEGILAFSVLGENVLPEVFSMPPESAPEGGLFFEPASELEHRIGVEDYGRSWVTESFVRSALETAIPTKHPPCRVERALWHYQDLWLASASANPSPLAAEIDAGPDGRIYAAALGPERRLSIEGWAVHPGQPDRELEVELWRNDERLATARPNEPRPDVARHFGAEDEWKAGWAMTLEPADLEGGLGTPLLLKAVDSRGLQKILHLGSVETLLADQRLREVEGEIAAIRARLEVSRVEGEALREDVARAEGRAAVIEQSGFGRLRRWWMGVKGRGS